MGNPKPETLPCGLGFQDGLRCRCRVEDSLHNTLQNHSLENSFHMIALDPECVCRSAMVLLGVKLRFLGGVSPGVGVGVLSAMEVAGLHQKHLKYEDLRNPDR